MGSQLDNRWKSRGTRTKFETHDDKGGTGGILSKPTTAPQNRPEIVQHPVFSHHNQLSHFLSRYRYLYLRPSSSILVPLYEILKLSSPKIGPYLP